MSLTPSRRAVLAGARGAALAGIMPARPLRAAVPARIAVMELDIAEAMLALGVPPVAMAEAGRFRELFVDAALPETCLDLGASWEPNLERLDAIAPDRVLTSGDRAMLVPLLERIAPVTLIEPDDTAGRAHRGAELMGALGQQLGLPEAAEAVLADAHRRLAAVAANLVGKTRRPVFLAALVDDGAHLEIYGRGCLLDDALRAAGLRNACPIAMPAYGWVIAGIERIADSPDAIVLILDFGGPTRRMLDRLARSALWRSLPPVAAGRVKLVRAASVWGGVPTLAAFAERIGAALHGIAPDGD